MKKYIVPLLLAAAAVSLTVSCSKLTGTKESPPADISGTEASTETGQTAAAEQPEPSVAGTTAPAETPTAPAGTGAGDGYNWEKTAIIGTDLHYLSRQLTDYGSGFQYMVEHGDGKVMTYVEPIVDAFLEEVAEKKPDVLILTGDISFNGEYLSHQELAAKLYSVEEQGIPVLVIPGNHDANNPAAAEFRKEDRLPAATTTPAQFREIYQDFGYNEALSEDESSLSYVYRIDEYNWMFMLDSCLFYPQNHEGGAIHPETLKWLEQQLELAWDEGVNAIVCAHHNLLDESEVYAFNCTIENNEELRELLAEGGVRLFLSGHLHVQHNKEDEDYGIYEIVTSSLVTPQCQYGMLTFRDDSGFSYHTEILDVEAWARKHQRTEEDLLNFEAFKEPFLRRVFYNQSYDILSGIPELRESHVKQMSEFYSDLNYHYYQGTAYKIAAEAKKTAAYKLWEEYSNYVAPADYVQYILEDALRDYNILEVD